MAYGCRRIASPTEDSMGYERQKSFNAHDPLGLIAMPMAPMTAGLEHSVADCPKLTTDGGQSTGAPTAVRTIGGALIIVLVVVGLVAPPGPATDPGIPSRTGTSQSYAAWCPHSNAPLVFASRHPIRELFGRALMIQR
jgi:hypothetical protein